MNIGTMNIDNLMDTITEDEATNLIHILSKKFDWAMCYYTKEDVVRALQDKQKDYDNLPTDEQVDKVMATRIWKKIMEEAMCHTGWECMLDAIYDSENGYQK